MDSLLPTLQEEMQVALRESQSCVRRNYAFPEAEGVAKVAIGMRRSGKTYFLFQTMRDLLARGIPLEQILYINFEDDRLQPMDQKKMGAIVDAFFALHPALHDQHCFLFLDEVQNVEGWPTVVRRLLDSKDLDIYITGSSAKLLSKEIATSLRGRSLAVEIQPYDFEEYLASKHVPLPSKPMGRKHLDQYNALLAHFFKEGGFPGVQSFSDQARIEMLQSYVEVVVFRDVVERHKVSNISLLKYFTQVLLKNAASRFSVNKFHKDIHSQGYRVGKDTLYAYLDYLEDAFMVYTVPLFSESLRQLETTPKKIYAVDNGLIQATTFSLASNYGKLFENQVYLDLRRQKKEIFYYITSEGYEVDFVTKDLLGKYEIVQVAWDQKDRTTMEREVRALKAAEKELGIAGRIIDAGKYLDGLVPNHISFMR